MSRFYLALFSMILCQSAFSSTCEKILLNSSLKNESKQLILQNLIVSNSRFPQSDTAIHASLMSLVFRKGEMDFSWSYSEKNIQEIFDQAERAHKAHGINPYIREGRVNTVFNGYKDRAPQIMFKIIELLAANLPAEKNPLKSLRESVDHLTEESQPDYRTLFSQIYDSQTLEGKSFLARLGQVIHEFLWLEDSKKLSLQWRDFLAGEDNIEHFNHFSNPFRQFSKRFFAEFNTYLTKELPELNGVAFPAGARLGPNYFYKESLVDEIRESSFSRAIFDLLGG